MFNIFDVHCPTSGLRPSWWYENFTPTRPCCVFCLVNTRTVFRTLYGFISNVVTLSCHRCLSMSNKWTFDCTRHDSLDLVLLQPWTFTCICISFVHTGTGLPGILLLYIYIYVHIFTCICLYILVLSYLSWREKLERELLVMKCLTHFCFL